MKEHFMRYVHRFVWFQPHLFLLLLVGLLPGCTTRHINQPPMHEAAGVKPNSELGNVKWVVPAGWVSTVPAPLEVVTFAIPDAAGDGQAKVMKVNGNEFPLLPNANRCRQQIGLGLIDQHSLNEILKPVKTASGEQGKAFELIGAEKSVLFAAVARGESTWFFKLMAPNNLAWKQRDSFYQFISSFYL